MMKKIQGNLYHCFIAVFNNIRTLKFKFTFFVAVNHLSGPVGKMKLTSAGSKGHVCRS